VRGASTWYNGVSQADVDAIRSDYAAKTAVGLCGWLEGVFDEDVCAGGNNRRTLRADADSVTGTDLSNKTAGTPAHVAGFTVLTVASVATVGIVMIVAVVVVSMSATSSRRRRAASMHSDAVTLV